MAFPGSPTNGQTTIVNGITYVYDATYQSWTRTPTPLDLTTFSAGNIFANAIYTTDGLFWYGNNVAFSSSTYSNVNVEAYIGGNIGAYQIYANANAAAQAISITSLATDANANTAAYLTTYTGNIQAGNIAVTGNINVTSNVSADKLYTANGLYWAGNGVAFSSGGGTYTANTLPPVTGNIVGDQWYNTTTDVLYEYLDNGTKKYWVDVQSPILFANTSTTVNVLGETTVTGNLVPSANVTYNIGSVTNWWGTYFGVATQAKYADLAENYQADAAYEPGTVLEFGGTNEVTIAEDGTRRVAGVVSTNPAHLMNGGLTGENVVAIALQGRTPCRVRGKISKGDMLVSGGAGFARPDNSPQLGAVIGKSLEDFDGFEGVIEVVVGRL